MKLYSALTLFSLFATGYSDTEVKISLPGTSASCSTLGMEEVSSQCVRSLVEDGSDDYRTQSDITPPTQLLANANKPANSSAIGFIPDIGSTGSNRILTYEVELTDNDYTDGYSRCEIINLAGKELGKHITYVEQSVPDAEDDSPSEDIVGFRDDDESLDKTDHGKRGKLTSSGNTHTCTFYLLNNEWIGAVDIQIGFERTDISTTRANIIKAKLSLTYKPTADDPQRTGDQTERLRDCVIQYKSPCVQTSSKYFLRDSTEGCSGANENTGTVSVTDKGDISLQMSCIFLDERYKVADLSGTNVLLGVGGVDIGIEGIPLQSKYDSWHVSSDNVMSASNVQLHKIAYSDRMTSGKILSHVVGDGNTAADFSNKGVKDAYLKYTSAVTYMSNSTNDAVKNDLDKDYGCSSSNYNCYAQHVLEHTMQIKYAQLPQFSTSYIGCGAGCDPLVTITGISGAVNGKISTKIELSINDLPESNNIIEIPGPKLESRGNQIENPDWLRLTKLYDISSTTDYLLKTSGNIAPRSLDAPLQVAGNFTFTSEHPGTNAAFSTPMAALVSNTIPNQNCKSLVDLVVSDLALNPTARYQTLFAQCFLEVPTNAFGAPYVVEYRKGNGASNGEADALTIYENDGRKLYFGARALDSTFNDKTDDSVWGSGNVVVVGTAITIRVQKYAYKISLNGVDQKNVAIKFNITTSGSAYSGHLEDTPIARETAADNGDFVDWTLQSNALCTGSILINIADQTEFQGFQVYKAKIPCARMSAVEPITDSVNMKFKFDARLDLEEDKLFASADYQNNSDTTVEAFFGTCGSGNQLSKTNSVGCNSTIFDFTKTDVSKDTFQLVVKDSTTDGTAAASGMATLKACSGTSITDTSTDYIRTFSLAMKYDRDLTSKTGFDTDSSTTYCDSQQFTMTINRKKTATIVAATIQNVDLVRAVLVKDIKWVKKGELDSTQDCPNVNDYRLYVLLQSVDGDARDGGGAYTNSELTQVQDQSSSAKLQVFEKSGKTVLDALAEIKFGSGGATAVTHHGNHFKLQGTCVTIDDVNECDLSKSNDWSDYSKPFDTEVVITGKYNFQAVATNVKITLNYVACPVLDDSNDQEGQIVLALQSDCADEIRTGLDAQSVLQSLAQPAAANGAALWEYANANSYTIASAENAGVHFDCKKAYSDDFIKVQGSIYQLGSSCTSAKMDPKEELTFDPSCALTDDSDSTDWTVDSINITLVHKTSGGDVEARLCYRESGGACTMEATSISSQALDQFDGVTDFNKAGKPFRPYQLCCADTMAKDGDVYWTSRAKPSLNALNASALVSAPGTDFLTVFIPLNALGQFPADTFEVRYDAILKNSNMRRHLRATHALRSSNSGAKSASIGGVEILEPEVVAASTQDAPAPNAPEQPVAENVAGSSSSTESSSKKPWYGFGVIEESAVAGLWVIAVVVWLVILFAAYELIALVVRQCGGDTQSVFSSMSRSRTNYAPVSNPVGERFTNLRY